MQRTFLFLFCLFSFSVSAQTIDEKVAEIDAYAQTVLRTHGGPGMAIAIVKDDKVIFQKGYGVKRLQSSESLAIIEPNTSVEMAYRNLYLAVKNRDMGRIVGNMSRKTWSFSEMVSIRQESPLEKIYANGFTATTFANALPAIRDQRIKDNFGAVEVYNAKDQRWEDLPFVFENGGWRLAIGELFAGTFRSPGKSRSTIELEQGKREPETTQVKSGTASGSASATTATSIGISDSPMVDENTVFAIASNSKAFLTATLAILVDEKKLSWDDKVSKYLPEFQMYDPWVTSELTIRDLVTHRVGLDTFSGDLLWYETTYKPEEILARVKHLKPVSSFRSRFGYQNLMFIAAGQVVEKVSGKKWCDYVKERILDPLRMTRTTCSVNDLPDNAAWPHNESGGKLRVLHRGNVDGSSSAAALNSSVSDLSNWIRTQLGKGKFEGRQIFSEQQAWAMHQPYLSQQISEAASKTNPTRHFSGVAMGWFVYDYHGRKIINHSGGLDGMLSYTVLIPEENVGYVVLTNSESPAFGIMTNKIRDVFVGAPKRDWNTEAVENVKQAKTRAEDAKKKVDESRAANTRPSLALSAYAGKYSDKMYGDITVTDENGRLVMRFLPSPNFVADLEHWHYDTFVIRWRPSVAYNFPRGFVTFTIDKNGNPDELKIDQPNNDFWFYELAPRRVQP